MTNQPRLRGGGDPDAADAQRDRERRRVERGRSPHTPRFEVIDTTDAYQLPADQLEDETNAAVDEIYRRQANDPRNALRR